jgi:hypothetical protein
MEIRRYRAAQTVAGRHSFFDTDPSGISRWTVRIGGGGKSDLNPEIASI